MQLSLAFLAYASFMVYDQRTSGRAKGPITAHLISQSSSTDYYSASNITTVTEFAQQMEHVIDADLPQTVTANQQEELLDIVEATFENTAPDVTVPSTDTHSPTHASGHADEVISGAVPSEECIGHPPIAKPTTYPIRYPLSTKEHPLAEGVYSNCKVCALFHVWET